MLPIVRSCLNARDRKCPVRLWKKCAFSWSFEIILVRSHSTRQHDTSKQMHQKKGHLSLANAPDVLMHHGTIETKNIFRPRSSPIMMLVVVLMHTQAHKKRTTNLFVQLRLFFVDCVTYTFHCIKSHHTHMHFHNFLN